MGNVTGCKFLSYDETKYTKDCSIAGLGNDKATWERSGPSGFQLCQFCTKRGRINQANGCTSKDTAHCSDYEDAEHEVILR